MPRFILPLVLLLLVVTSMQAWAVQVVQTISYQGVLTDAGGVVVPNNTYTLTFRIYNAASGGGALWAEVQPGISVTNGEFSVILGNVTPLTLPFDTQYWLGIAVGPDQELTPRVQFTSSPYAYTAQNAFSATTAVNNPGISQGKGSGATAITSTTAMADVIVTSITIPTDGYIVVDASAWAVLGGTTGDNVVDYQIDETLGGAVDASQSRAVGGQGFPNTLFYNQTAAAKRVYQKTAGTYTFRLEAKKGGLGSCSFYNPTITAMYFPAGYGTVTP